MKISRRQMNKARIEMIPLIDVVFLLLVAFIFFAMSMTINRGIPVDLPVSSAAQVEDKDVSEITIEKGGTVFFDREEIDTRSLHSRLALLHRESPGTRIIVSGDREASYESIMSVIDAVKRAGISGLSLKTESRNQEMGTISEDVVRYRQ
ncbi:MAG: biopolymer transporter ExbD [Syntrophobacterales bacterium]|nr:MAG: biopolymer transporter ExbD [Syntrophobacterales bacterium]